MKFSIREKRKAAGFTQEYMAEMLGISPGLYNGLETGKRRMNETYLEGIANILRVTVSELIIEDRPTIAIAGKVGAGARVDFFRNHQSVKKPAIERPIQTGSDELRALLVEGDGMSPIFNEGDYLIFKAEDSAGGVPDDAVGHICIATDEHGVSSVRHVTSGPEPGLFHLLGLKPGTTPDWDARLKWAARVRLHWPAEFARKA
ncbi:helix-turn-helix domain-containing protein [Alloyangia pacifica]|uniref:helix-turn-helix domain-containing protein n=2 Tax=Roseobacteraceae TaxID=2854170 RepID=UPI0031D64A0E